MDERRNDSWMKELNEWMDNFICEWMNGYTDRWKDRWMDGWGFCCEMAQDEEQCDGEWMGGGYWFSDGGGGYGEMTAESSAPAFFSPSPSPGSHYWAAINTSINTFASLHMSLKQRLHCIYLILTKTTCCFKPLYFITSSQIKGFFLLFSRQHWDIKFPSCHRFIPDIPNSAFIRQCFWTPRTRLFAETLDDLEKLVLTEWEGEGGVGGPKNNEIALIVMR